MDELVQLSADATGSTGLWYLDRGLIFDRFAHIPKLLRWAEFRAAHWAQKTMPLPDYVILSTPRTSTRRKGFEPKFIHPSMDRNRRARLAAMPIILILVILLLLFGGGGYYMGPGVGYYGGGGLSIVLLIVILFLVFGRGRRGL
jgi:hypothetical protein